MWVGVLAGLVGATSLASRLPLKRFGLEASPPLPSGSLSSWALGASGGSFSALELGARLYFSLEWSVLGCSLLSWGSFSSLRSVFLI